MLVRKVRDIAANLCTYYRVGDRHIIAMAEEGAGGQIGDLPRRDRLLGLSR